VGLGVLSQPLRARTYLGDNTAAILDALCSHLGSITGIELRADPGRPGSSPDATEHAGEFDLVWACGLLTSELIASGSLEADIVAAPVFAGQREAVYHSVVISRADSGFNSLADSLSGRLAINEEESWSGHHGLLEHVIQQGLGSFKRVLRSGSHRESARAVVAGSADAAAIDHTVWEHLLQSDDEFSGIEVIDRTLDWPAPPFSIRSSIDPDIRARLINSLTSVGPGDIEGLERIDRASASTYTTMGRS
jgi:ABC-type phosphate/phosphonate transport system substrate-binding protein